MFWVGVEKELRVWLEGMRLMLRLRLRLGLDILNFISLIFNCYLCAQLSRDSIPSVMLHKKFYWKYSCFKEGEGCNHDCCKIMLAQYASNMGYYLRPKDQNQPSEKTTKGCKRKRKTSRTSDNSKRKRKDDLASIGKHGGTPGNNHFYSIKNHCKRWLSLE